MITWAHKVRLPRSLKKSSIYYKNLTFKTTFGFHLLSNFIPKKHIHKQIGFQNENEVDVATSICS